MITINVIFKSKYFPRALLIISITLFILGIYFPIFTSTRFFFCKQDISLLKFIQLLFEDGSYFLAIIILLFTFLFPIIKYIFLFMLSFDLTFKKRNLVIKYLKNAGKWSMLDVFVIAMLILLFKLKSGLFTIQIKFGTIFFALAIITSIFCSSLFKGNRNSKTEVNKQDIEEILRIADEMSKPKS